MFQKIQHIILILLLLSCFESNADSKVLPIEFLGDTIALNINENLLVPFGYKIDDESISKFYQKLNQTEFQPLINQLHKIQSTSHLNDWLYYQLIRKTAQAISPKLDNYYRYTLYKWFLLTKSGFDATLSFGSHSLLFYVRSEENIYGIPFFERNGNQYICLNYHDYGEIDFKKEPVSEISTRVPEGQKSFSYKVMTMPDFKPADYAVKELQFNYRDKVYHFNVKLNPQIKSLFANYPVADFETYFNIPLSHETYSSLLPDLKKNIASMDQKEGVDFLMRFTRYSFLYETDQQNFGKEKRLSPEQTLLYDYSDCDDRAGLFFYLVKEIYNLPMIVLLYPTHVTIAVQFDKPIGKPIIYKGRSFSLCDPTPQLKDLDLGQISKHLKHSDYQVVYEYNPQPK